MMNIDINIARRFILGKQGLWPGRRWQGLEGTTTAMREIEYLQLDPLQMIARSHDIQLHSRVIGYQPGLWEEPTYQQRNFFDWGGWLSTRPMAELPYWRTVMQRERDGHVDCDPRTKRNGAKYAEVITEIRELLQEMEVLSNRDFDLTSRTKTDHYRGRKDSSLALYHLWRTGEVMTHHRKKFERVYALGSQVAPPQFLFEKDDEEVDHFLIKKEISFAGLSRLQRTQDAFYRGVPFSQKKVWIEKLLDAGEIIEVKVEGWRQTHYALSSDVHLLETLSAGDIPGVWAPLETNTTEETVFLAPLDPVSARGRAKILFGFDYVWEVYKPKEKRQYGYYVLPILWGDQLVGRFDSKFDRETETFVILGLWLEDDALASNEEFVEALGKGFERFVTFLSAKNLDANLVNYHQIKKRIDVA